MHTVEQALKEQRKNIDFSPTKLSQFLFGKEFYYQFLKYIEGRTILKVDFNLFNRGRVQILKQAIRQMPIMMNQMVGDLNPCQFLYFILNSIHQMPGGVHLGMFIKCIQMMGNQEQRLQYEKKCFNFQIIGCYAQTQMGHGSDVSSLQTTAEFDEANDQFILNTPNISSYKYWPGDLGLFATHALVFANTTIKGKNYHVQSFLVQIRDRNTFETLPGIQAGDIGPKIGFHAKDNGYLILKNVKVPRKNMMARYTMVSKDGSVKRIGNPQVTYATMMQIRQLIACLYPKIYSSVITIATRYSMFRRQFKNEKKQQIKVIDYQLQQQKIISRVAEYYAIAIAGNKIKALSDKNVKKVLQNNNFQLMAQTHACLCVGKTFFSQLVYEGMEICRKACGGHGFSQYSGIPNLIHQYAANLTHEGENTVLYLQLARYILKSYKHFITKKKPINQSISYISSYYHLMAKKCEINEDKKWNLQDIKTLLDQGVCFLISIINSKIGLKNNQQSSKDFQNKQVGLRLRQLAFTHAINYTFNAFSEAVFKEKDERIKQITQNICLLFGTNMILSYGSPIIEGNFVSSEQIKSLSSLKKQLLIKIRPILIGIVDGFGIPDILINSALISGNPYENYLKLARQNELNHSRQQSVDIVKSVKNYIRNPNPAL